MYDEIITNTILQYNLSPHHKGYKYIRDAIQIILSKNCKRLSLKTHVYIPLAIKYDTAVNNIEKCISSAINKTFEKNNPDFLSETFGYDFNVQTGKVNNKAFLMTIADKIYFAHIL